MPNNVDINSANVAIKVFTREAKCVQHPKSPYRFSYISCWKNLLENETFLTVINFRIL